MLIYLMSVSVDGFTADREGPFGWAAPSEELFRFHLTQRRELGGFLLGRGLYETMLVWETDPSMRDSELDAASLRRSSGRWHRFPPTGSQGSWTSPRRSHRPLVTHSPALRATAPGEATYRVRVVFAPHR